MCWALGARQLTPQRAPPARGRDGAGARTQPVPRGACPAPSRAPPRSEPGSEGDARRGASPAPQPARTRKGRSRPCGAGRSREGRSRRAGRGGPSESGGLREAVNSVSSGIVGVWQAATGFASRAPLAGVGPPGLKQAVPCPRTSSSSVASPRVGDRALGP